MSCWVSLLGTFQQSRETQKIRIVTLQLKG